METAQTTNNPPYSSKDIEAAYRAIYGGLPASMMDTGTGGLAKSYENGIYPGAVLQTPGGQQIDASQLMYMYQTGQKQQAQAGATGGAASQSYLTNSPSSGGSQNMNWSDIAQAYGVSPGDIQVMQSRGWSPEQVLNSFQQQGKTPVAQSAASQQDAFGITRTDSGKGYTTLKTASGKELNVDNAGNYFTTDASGNNVPVSDIDAQKMGFQSALPETQALKQMQQIDPGTEALRSQLSGSYTDPSKAAHPEASEYQSYLDTFKQVDPQEYAARAGLGTSMDSYLKSVQDEYALGSQLDPVTQMQVEQQARAAQAARGNLYGSGQGAVEAMTTGQAGQALKQQRLGNLQTALGGEQSYLGAGLGLGDTAMQLYQQGLANKAQAQQSALSYLGSGSTPYQAGQSYLANAEGTAGSAAQGGPQYNPAALGQSYTGSASAAPQYGLDVGAQAQNWFNSLSNQQGGGGAPTKNKGVSAGVGALSGAASGAAAGSVVPGWGTAIGAVVGGIAGGASGYYS